MRERVKSITEHTLVPISLVISMGGGIVFVTLLHFETTANTQAITEIRSKVDSVNDIRTDIAVIKTQLDAIQKKLGNGP